MHLGGRRRIAATLLADDRRARLKLDHSSEVGNETQERGSRATSNPSALASTAMTRNLCSPWLGRVSGAPTGLSGLDRSSCPSGRFTSAAAAAPSSVPPELGDTARSHGQLPLPRIGLTPS